MLIIVSILNHKGGVGQTTTVVTMIAGFPHRSVDFETVAQVIKAHSGVKHHPGDVWRILRDLDWSPQKPEWRVRDRTKRSLRPGARLYGNNVSIEYQTPGYGHLIIMQSQKGFLQSEWDRVPPDAVVPVKIGELDGEIAHGTFVKYPGEASATWNPDASLTRMRWVNNGVWVVVTLHGDAHEYLDLAGLIKLAESLTIQP